MRLAVILLAALASAWAQKPAAAPSGPSTADSQASFKVDVKLVRLLVNVKDSRGDLVGSLTKSDFTVYDCGVKQDIAAFDTQTDLPLYVSVLIDTSASTLKDISYEKTSISRFLKALLGSGNPKDMAAVYTFNHEIVLLQSFTHNTGRLNASLRDIKSIGSTSLFDAIVLSAQEVSRRDGRHVIVVVTDGGDTSSRYMYRDAIREAHLADAVVYPIVVVPITNDAGRNVGGENALSQVAKDTGGRTFYPAVGPTLDQAFADILRDLRRQYVLGYYPRDLPKDAPAFHPVRVEMARPDLRPSTRAGYYGVSAQ